MRIMEIISCDCISGPVIHCANLSRELVHRGHNVTILCPPGAWIAQALAAEPIEMIHSDMRRFPPGELLRISREIRSRGIDVVHTHMSRAHFFGVLLRWFAGIPSVATAHSRHFQLHWMLNDLVIAVSEVTRKYHIRHNWVRSKRTAMIHNFVMPELLNPVPEAVKEAARLSLGAAKEEFLLGIVGSVVANKGHHHLLRAFPKIHAAVPGVRLAIVGAEFNAEYSRGLRREIKELGIEEQVYWAGQRTDMPAVMAALDICVLPSLNENLPMVALESMAASVPIVATTVGGIPECIIHEKTGLLIPPGDAAALADTLIALLNDPEKRRQLGAAGRCQVAEKFLAPQQVALVENAFQRVVGAK